MTTTKRIIVIFTVAYLLLSLAGCAVQSVPSPTEAPAMQSQTFPPEPPPPTQAPTAPPQTQSPAPTAFTGYFAIEGKWKVMGEKGYAMAQPGSIIVFNGMNCNFISPNDTYAFYEDGGSYRLNVTPLLSGNQSFSVKIIDENNIELPGLGMSMLRVG